MRYKLHEADAEIWHVGYDGMITLIFASSKVMQNITIWFGKLPIIWTFSLIFFSDATSDSPVTWKPHKILRDQISIRKSHFWLRIVHPCGRHFPSPKLTCKILVITDVGMPPWVITPVCYSLVFSYPDQTIWAVIQLRFPKLALPIAITVLNIAHDLGLC